MTPDTAARTVRLSAATDVGRLRDENQDAAVVAGRVLQTGSGAWAAADHATPLVAVVVDGMGGHAGGREAAAVAAEVLADVEPDDGVVAALAAAFPRADAATRARSAEDPSVRGLGSVAVAVAVTADRAVVMNVGDAPALRLASDGGLERLHTEDADAWGAITRCFGGWGDDPLAEAHVRDLGTWTGTLVLASDGLTAALDDATVAAELRRGGDDLADRLVERSLGAGAPDNVTVVVVEVPPPGR